MSVDPHSRAVQWWSISFPAAVEYLGVGEGPDGAAELIAGTADGVLHRISC